MFRSVRLLEKGKNSKIKILIFVKCFFLAYVSYEITFKYLLRVVAIVRNSTMKYAFFTFLALREWRARTLDNLGASRLFTTIYDAPEWYIS